MRGLEPAQRAIYTPRQFSRLLAYQFAQLSMADRVRFERTVPRSRNSSLANCRLQPLTHRSRKRQHETKTCHALRVAGAAISLFCGVSSHLRGEVSGAVESQTIQHYRRTDGSRLNLVFSCQRSGGQREVPFFGASRSHIWGDRPDSNRFALTSQVSRVP